MRSNPEFMRNVWLELTPHRLVAMPVILGLIFALASTASTGIVPGVALSLFFLVTILWGAQLSSESLLEEFRQGTWDTQRLSAMGPWQLAHGKLLGAPLFAWYGGAICLAALIITAEKSSFDLPLVPLVLGVLAMAFLAHALGGIVGLAAARSGIRGRSSILLIVLFLSIPFGTPLLSALAPGKTTAWFGFTFSTLWFAVFSLWAFAGWAAVGLWRLMCRELQLRKPPTAWLGFVVFLSFHASGLLVGRFVDGHAVTLFTLVAFTVTLAMSYGVVLFDQRDFISMRRLVHHWQNGNTRRVWEEVPCWTVTLPLALVAAGYLALQDSPLDKLGPPGTALGFVPLALCLFALRDIALLHFFSLGPRPQKAVMATLVYLGLLYWLLPSLLGAADLDAVAAWLRPSPGSRPLVSISAGLLNAAVAIALVAWRWRQRLASMAR